jgi:hypothetical protein
MHPLDQRTRLFDAVRKAERSARDYSEARIRLKTGEPASRIADAYHVGIDTIRQLGR